MSSVSLFKRIAYVYIGTKDFESDRDFYHKVLGARKVWEFKELGARVAAFDLCGEPYLLIADHVKAPSKRLIFEVASLSEASSALKKRGWKPDGGQFEIPDGPCLNFHGCERERVRDSRAEAAENPREERSLEKVILCGSWLWLSGSFCRESAG